jgi:hypothetical protein
MKHKLFFLILVLIGITTLSYAQFTSESFEGTFPPTGWTNNGCEQVGSAVTAAQSGSYCVRLTGGNDYLITPLIEAPATLNYYHKKETGNSTFSLQYSSSASGPWTNLAGYPVAVGQGWTLQTINLSAYSNIYLRWYYTEATKTMYLDNISMTAAVPATQASNVNFTDIQLNQVTINWTTGSGSNDVVFVREATAGTPGNPTDGTTYTASTNWNSKGTQLGSTGYYCVYNGPGTSLTLTSLAMGTVYYVIVYTYNGIGGASVYKTGGATGNVTTLSGTQPTDRFRTIATGNWNNTAIWESSSDGTTWISATAKPTINAFMVYLNHNVNLTMNEACGDLTFNAGGSVTFGNFNLNIGGTIYGQAVFYYTGTGLPSQETTTSNTDVTIPNPTTIPSILNTLTIDSNTNTVTIPNNVTYNTMNFNSGNLFFNGYMLTHNGENIAYSSDDAVLSALTDTYSGTSNVYNYHGVDNYSIASTWTLSGSFSGGLNIHFTYPKAQSSSPFMRVWYRPVSADATDPWTIWGGFDLVGLPAVDNGTTMTLSIYGVTTLSDGSKGPLNWTISELDQTLPVELSTFTAWLTQQYFVELHWVTQSETDATGYNVYRNYITSLSSAQRVNPYLIQATNTSQEASYNFVDIDAELGTWYYWLECKNMNGVSDFYGPISITVTDGSGSPDVPELTNLSKIYPNPFNPMRSTLTSSFSLSKSEEISISIFNVKGEKVRSLISGNHNAGSYPIKWNGKDENGKICSSGVYYMTMTTSNYSTTRKIVVMK